MSSSLLNLTQNLVRATKDWPVLSAAYRSAYRVAAGAAGRLVSKNEAIVGIYARNSYSLGTWEPGISDIDLTIVLRQPTSEQIADLHTRYDRLRRRFPMLGEVEMLDEAHLTAWTSRAVTGLDSKRWLKLAGEHRLECCYSGDERLDRLRHAVSIYRYNLMPIVWQPKPDGSTFLRFAAKLFRQLGKPMPLAKDQSAALTTCLKHLSAEVASLGVTEDGPPLDYATLLRGAAPSLAERREEPVPCQGACAALLGRANETTPRYRLVRPEVARLDWDGAKTIVMDLNVFRFYLCFVDPLEYLALLRRRTIFCGADPLSIAFPLSKHAFLGSVKHYAVEMLTCPYRSEIRNMSDGSFKDLLYGWFLRTLRFLEDGEMDFEYHTLRHYFGTRHLETTPADRVRLLLGIAQDLSQHLQRDH